MLTGTIPTSTTRKGSNMPYQQSNNKSWTKAARAKRRGELKDFFISAGHTRKVALQLAKQSEKQ